MVKKRKKILGFFNACLDFKQTCWTHNHKKILEIVFVLFSKTLAINITFYDEMVRRKFIFWKLNKFFFAWFCFLLMYCKIDVCAVSLLLSLHRSNVFKLFNWVAVEQKSFKINQFQKVKNDCLLNWKYFLVVKIDFSSKNKVSTVFERGIFNWNCSITFFLSQHHEQILRTFHQSNLTFFIN